MFHSLRYPTCFARRKMRKTSICCRNCSQGSCSYFYLPLANSFEDTNQLKAHSDWYGTGKMRAKWSKKDCLILYLKKWAELLLRLASENLKKSNTLCGSLIDVRNLFFNDMEMMHFLLQKWISLLMLYNFSIIWQKMARWLVINFFRYYWK